MAAQRATGAEIVMAMPMPDEPAWAHLNRLALLNNGTGSSVVSAWTGAKTYLTDSMGSALAAGELLAACAGCTVEEYVANHAISRKLVREAAGLSCDIRRANYFVGSLLHEQGYLLQGPRIFKVCRACACDEVGEFGFAWLKMAHQVAGINVCWAHSKTLDRYPLYLTERIATPISTQERWIADAPDASPHFSDSADVELFHGIARWLWKLDSNEGVDVINEFLKRNVGGMYENHIRSASDRIQSKDSTRAWYASNFVGLSVRNLKKKPNVSLYQIAFAICGLGIDVNQVIDSLDEIALESNVRSI